MRRRPDEKGRYTNVFLAAPQDRTLVETSLAAGRDAPLLELTYNWDAEDYGEARYFGHLAFEVDDIYATCDRLMKAGVTINRPPRDGVMAFVRSPDRQSVELLQKGAALRCRPRSRGSRCRIPGSGDFGRSGTAAATWRPGRGRGDAAAAAPCDDGQGRPDYRSEVEICE